jgi:hypothetical protein
MPRSGAERTRAWRERKRTSEVTVQNVKKIKKINEIEGIKQWVICINH